MADNSNLIEKQRMISLDVLRGLMLVIMTFNHLGGPMKIITFQPLGFVSAAEGFIYLSGFVYGLVYTRTLISGNFHALKVKSIKRAGIIGIYHILILLVVILSMTLNVFDFKELIMFKDHPVKSFLLFDTFLLQPPYMDILPMYVLFILAGPAVLQALENGKAKVVLLISGCLWFLGQWKIFHYNDLNLTPYGLNFGHFNLMSWQFLFFTGVFLGYLKATGKLKLPVVKGLVVLSILTLVSFIAVRYLPNYTFIYRVFSHFADRDTLGIARLANFGVLAYLTYVLTSINENILKSNWLSFLGRHSLQVFAYSVCLVYFYSVFEVAIKSYDPWKEVAISLILVLSLSIPALLHRTLVEQFPAVKKMGL